MTTETERLLATGGVVMPARPLDPCPRCNGHKVYEGDPCRVCSGTGTDPQQERPMPKRIQMTRNKPWRADNPDAVIVDLASPCHADVLLELANAPAPQPEENKP